MAARSPPSPHPPPPARQLGPRSPRVGRGAEVHAVRSEASGFAGAAREVVADKSDKIWADKEFVWSLWKRLQVTNPDLTQVVSLVVERRPVEDAYHQNEEYTKKGKKFGLRKCEM
ncbi:centlein isoform X5 [Nomascus leucogenys]|uniref:centlein isoform X5 n=1 Tax=Nomascus leucogenys TaxID=61853 RepID=UPI00122D7D37|nr:centlein isoform X5 [Nomascus leucogenys]